MSSGKATLDTLIRADPSLTVVGTWLSLVEHSLGVRGVGSSNLPVPTNSNQNESILREFAILLQSFGKPPQVLIERRRIIPKRPVSRGGYYLNLRMGQTGFVLIDSS